jgi:hypothetical protein
MYTLGHFQNVCTISSDAANRPTNAPRHILKQCPTHALQHRTAHCPCEAKLQDMLNYRKIKHCNSNAVSLQLCYVKQSIIKVPIVMCPAKWCTFQPGNAA